ncbi:MAG TPA: hypothetical protein VE913_14985 [Longimicrobium sp.]|nr:hypothetical protein [Longimicrobium sp.]
MKGFLASPLINVLGAVIGGILLGFGVGRVAHSPTVGAALAVLFGAGLLWWSLFNRRRAEHGRD